MEYPCEEMSSWTALTWHEDSIVDQIYKIKYVRISVMVIFDYLQQLCGEIIEFLLYRRFPGPNWPAQYHERSENAYQPTRI